MRVSLLNLNLVARDAIGLSIIAQARFFMRRGDTVIIWLEQPPEGVPPDIAAICRVVTPEQLQRDRRGLFAATDLYIYHYGGRHGLMDSITTIDGGVVCFYYHNVTPPELWNVEAEKATLRRGIEGVKLAAHADFVFGDSKYNLRQLAEISGVSQDRLFPLPLPVDTSSFHPGLRPAHLCEKYGIGDEPILLYVGRMAPNKRIDLLVDVLAAVRKHRRHPYPTVRLLLAGDEASAPAYRLETERARARARGLGVEDGLIFTGRVDPQEYYRLASVYLTTSQHEGFCLPLIEAMASGVPVIAAATTAIPETVDDAAVLISTNAAGEANIGVMADAVVRILGDDAAAADLKTRGLAHSASFSLERYSAEFARVLDEQCVNLPQRVQPISQREADMEGLPDDEVYWPELADAAEITMPEYVVRSGAPVVGGLIAWVRHNMTTHVKEAYLDPILRRQQWYNIRNVHAVNQITRRLIAVEQQVAPKELRSDLMRLESQVARIESLLAEGPAGRASAAAAQPEVMEAAPQGVYGLSYLRCNRAVGGALKDEMALYAPFVPLYVGQAAPVLDVGCGQGVFLRLLEQAGIPGRGVDVDAGMVAICREAGLDAEQGDVFGYLSALSDASLGGIFCAHVIEHLPRARLMELAALCRQKLADGAALVWITPHGGSLSPLHATFYKDIAHTRPLHPDLLAFVLEANGFGTIEVRTLSDMPPERKLEMLPTKGGDAAEIINRNLARLNELIFGHVDCAVIGRK